MAVELGLNAKHALTVLTRLAHRRDEERHLLERALSGEGRLDALAEVAIEVGVETGDPIGLVLADRLRMTPSPRRARRLERVLPYPTVALREANAVVCDQALDGARQKVESSSGRLTPNLAASLDNFAGRLSDLGRREEALAAAEEAEGVLAPYFQSNPQAFASRMETLCANYARRYRELGRAPRPDLLATMVAALGKEMKEQHETVTRAVDIPTPHPAADPNRA